MSEASCSSSHAVDGLGDRAEGQGEELDSGSSVGTAPRRPVLTACGLEGEGVTSAIGGAGAVVAATRSSFVKPASTAIGDNDSLAASAASASSSSSASSSAASAPAPPRILVVEDNAVNRMIVTRFLRSLGHKDVTIATNGQEAVDAVATAYAAGRPFSIVLMDVQMPVMDGVTATKRIRELPLPGASVAAVPVALPIIALSASALKGDVDRCLAAGMQDHLGKPYNCSALDAKIKMWLPS